MGGSVARYNPRDSPWRLPSQGEHFESMDKVPDEKDSAEHYHGFCNPNYCVVSGVGGDNVCVASSDSVTTNPPTSQPINSPAYDNPINGEGFTNPSYDPGVGADQPVRVEMTGADPGDEKIRTGWQVVGRVYKCCGHADVPPGKIPKLCETIKLFALNLDIFVFLGSFVYL